MGDSIITPRAPSDEDLARWAALRILESFPGFPVGHQALQVAQAVVGFRVPADAKAAVLTVEVADVRLTVDGTAPAAGVGNGRLLPVGSTLTLTGLATVAQAQLIANGATTATVWADFFS